MTCLIVLYKNQTKFGCKTKTIAEHWCGKWLRRIKIRTNCRKCVVSYDKPVFTGVCFYIVLSTLSCWAHFRVERTFVLNALRLRPQCHTYSISCIFAIYVRTFDKNALSCRTHFCIELTFVLNVFDARRTFMLNAFYYRSHVGVERTFMLDALSYWMHFSVRRTFMLDALSCWTHFIIDCMLVLNALWC